MSNFIDTLYQIQESQEGIDKFVNLAEVIESGPTAADDELNSTAVMPYAIKYYDVDLDTRTIDSPEYLSIAKDHKAENIYFRMNRYYDYMDLATTTCIIQYQTPVHTGIYVVPYFDIVTGKGDIKTGTPDKLIISWCLDGKASEVAGTITYAIRFYRTDMNGKELLYNLNTLPATSKILYGMDVIDPDLGGDYDIIIEDSAYADLANAISELSKKDIYWIDYS